MRYFERKKQILDLLNSSNGSLTNDKLCNKLYVSKSTMRRDLISLEEEGLIKRHHGAVSLTATSALENSIHLRRMENQDKKNIIAKLCKNFLHDNMVIFLDSSSTITYLAPIIKSYENITIITNGINVANSLNTAPNIRCYLCPGILKPKSLSVIGEYSSDFLNNFRADISFLSCKAINKHGLFEGDDAQALSKRTMIKNSDKVIILCDNSKEFSTGYFKLADFSNIDVIISNAPFSPSLNEYIKEKSNLLIPK